MSLLPGTSERNLARAEAAVSHALAWVAGKAPRQVLVGLSGGRDSAALLKACCGALGPDAVTALYVDHGVRDDGAANLTAVEALAASARVALLVERIERGGSATETELRRRRMQAFTRASRRADDAPLLLGHHVDDEREGVALNLLRGHRTARGLAGIPTVRALSAHGSIVRPFVAQGARLTRSDLADVARDLAWRPDPTNADVAIPRNAVRAWLASDGARFTPTLDALVHGARGRLETVVREAATLLARGLVREGHGARWTGDLPRDDDVLAELLRLLGWTLHTRRRVDPRASILTALRATEEREAGSVDLPATPNPLRLTRREQSFHVLDEPLARGPHVTALVVRAIARTSCFL